MTNVIGPDISFYEDDPATPQGIDFKKMRASAGYVIIRAGQNAWIDSDFKLNWREAKPRWNVGKSGKSPLPLFNIKFLWDWLCTKIS